VSVSDIAISTRYPEMAKVPICKANSLRLVLINAFQADFDVWQRFSPFFFHAHSVRQMCNTFWAGPREEQRERERERVSERKREKERERERERETERDKERERDTE
jgi:hypothetical protein